MPNAGDLQISEDLIKVELRTLNDLPKELANTIAEISDETPRKK